MDSYPKQKRNARGFLSEAWGQISRRSPSASASREPLPDLSGQSSSPTISAIDQLNTTPHIFSAPEPTNQVGAAPQVPVQVSLPPLGASAASSGASSSQAPTIVVSPTTTAFSSASARLANLFTPTSPAPLAGSRATSGVWVELGAGLRALQKCAGAFPPLQSAISTFISCIDILEEVAKNHQEYNKLASELTSLAKLLEQHIKQSTSARMSDSIANVARCIEEQANSIESKRSRRAGRRLLEASADLDELESYYRQIGSLFRQLQADANLSIWSVVNDQMANTRLEGLMPVKLANYDSKLSEGISRRTCTANTRSAILSGLNDWSKDRGAPDLYWMNGMAGTGKTTIACTFSELLEERKQLGASFFCTRTVPECREATRIIPTIAYQLARYSTPFQSVLCETLSQDPDVGSKNVKKQLERLLKVPLLRVKEALPNDLVVVIDALDECDDMREVELLLSILFKFAADLPLKFFVTSRPEPEIHKRMLARVQVAGNVLHLHDVEKSLVQSDIETYLTEELEFMSPTRAQIKELARRSGNLFIYAATLVRYIRPGRRSVNPRTRLESALAMTSPPDKMHAEIDGLYVAVLAVALNAEGLEVEEVEDLQLVLWTAVCIQEPACVSTLTAITGINDEERVITALEALRSVIHFSEATGLVSALHASFPDFILDETRSGPFTCSLADHSALLARQCFEVMRTRLRFNICHLESSFLLDREIDDLEERVKQTIPQPLWYACCHWSDHLQNSACSDQLCTFLNDFLSNRLLFWMEVLNLKQEIREGAEILQKIILWLKVDIATAALARLADDARNFVAGFAANPVSQSTPHIYVSSLPFCPKSSSVFKKYWMKMRGVINVTGGAIRRREAAALASWEVNSRVYAVVFSPDGNRVAVGCSNSTVVVRDAHNGAIVTSPFQGHTDEVTSVAYSPDGTRITSGSSDTTVRVWSADDGAPITGPFRGHTDLVLSVTYSPDGSRIVSGSADKTIRVWGANDGALLISPLRGHTGWVSSVAYSPDGACIVSGSGDNTIRVWSAHDGVLLTGPLRGHTGWVLSVAYSPDGSCIVSGSNDGTIRVWSAHDAAQLTEPFWGSSISVTSVAYSPGGSCIVSGSIDNTIRVWSSRDGKLVAGPYRGHTDTIYSVSYSPDGSRIISGSWDGTIRAWSAPNSTLPAGSFKAHPNWVNSVAYSPNGSHIVSGSWDGVIRVWSAHNGKLLSCSSEEHDDEIWFVAYSPDGNSMVSCSSDCTIRIWNAHPVSPLTPPLCGHTAPVLSVGYSPDGLFIVSGSEDKTIRVWSAYDGKLIAGPFRGHTGGVTDAAYSPDGSRIASGSHDATIRVWGARNGELLLGPLQGHTNWVVSIAYSPDGSRIVSGSSDNTIRVWSAHNGTLLAGPLQGHTGSIWSVTYSPDGSHIVSGSFDKTIRVWRAYDGVLLAGPFQGHAGPVRCVAYSSDGFHVASGSGDETIRVWSTHTTPGVSGLLEKQTELVCHPDATHTPSPSTPSPIYNNYEMNSALVHQTVRPDGWVRNACSQPLFWVPPELAGYLPSGQELLVLYPHDLFQMDDNAVFLGELWHRCYVP